MSGIEFWALCVIVVGLYVTFIVVRRLDQIALNTQRIADALDSPKTPAAAAQQIKVPPRY